MSARLADPLAMLLDAVRLACSEADARAVVRLAAVMTKAGLIDCDEAAALARALGQQLAATGGCPRLANGESAASAVGNRERS